MTDYSKERGGQLGVMSVWGDVAKADGGLYDGTEVNKVNIDGSGIEGVHVFDGSGIYVKQKLHKKNAHFKQQEIAASRCRKDVGIDIAGL